MNKKEAAELLSVILNNSRTTLDMHQYGALQRVRDELRSTSRELFFNETTDRNPALVNRMMWLVQTENNKIENIKIVRNEFNLSLIEAKNIWEEFLYRKDHSI